MRESTLEMLERWEPLAVERRVFDIFEEMARLTLTIVGRALLSIDLSDQAEVIGRAFTVGNERFAHFDLGMLMPFLPTRRNLRFRRAVRTLHQVVDEIIAQRRRESRDRGDLLSMLLDARDEETGEGMDDSGSSVTRYSRLFLPVTRPPRLRSRGPGICSRRIRRCNKSLKPNCARCSAAGLRRSPICER